MGSVICYVHLIILAIIAKSSSLGNHFQKFSCMYSELEINDFAIGKVETRFASVSIDSLQVQFFLQIEFLDCRQFRLYESRLVVSLISTESCLSSNWRNNGSSKRALNSLNIYRMNSIMIWKTKAILFKVNSITPSSNYQLLLLAIHTFYIKIRSSLYAPSHTMLISNCFLESMLDLAQGILLSAKRSYLEKMEYGNLIMQ